MSNIRKGYVLTNKERRGLAKQTMLFVLPRIPFTVLGVIVGGVFPIAFAYISSKLNLDHFALVTTIGGILGAFVYKLVLTWGAREYKAGEIAIIASKLERGVIPEPVFKSGLTLVHTYFEAATFGRVFLNFVDALFKKIVKKNNEYSFKQIIKKAAFYLRDALLVFVLDLFPYLGCCALYTVFAHTELTTLEAYKKGTKVFFKNYFRIFLRLIKNLLIVIIIFTITFSILFAIMLILCGLAPVLLSGTIKLMEFIKLSAVDNDVAIVAPAFLAAILSIACVVLSQPNRVIKTLERFKVLYDKEQEQQGSNNTDDNVEGISKN